MWRRIARKERRNARQPSPRQYLLCFGEQSAELVSVRAYAIVNKSSYRHMEQEPRKDTSKDILVPEPPAAPPPEDPTSVMRPEDEALVAERLRELGYIE